MSKSCLDCLIYLQLDVKFMDRYKLFKPITMCSNNQNNTDYFLHTGKTALNVCISEVN